MVKLKTLKNFVFTAIEDRNQTYQQGFVDGVQDCHDKIKSEGVKWFKEFKNLQAYNYGESEGSELNLDWLTDSRDISAFDFIKHFFNLTKEDLK